MGFHSVLLFVLGVATFPLLSPQLKNRRNKSIALIAVVLLIELIHSKDPSAHQLDGWLHEHLELGLLSVSPTAFLAGILSFSLFFYYVASLDSQSRDRPRFGLIATMAFASALVSLLSPTPWVTVAVTFPQQAAFCAIISKIKAANLFERRLWQGTTLLYNASFLTASLMAHPEGLTPPETLFGLLCGALIGLTLIQLFMDDLLQLALGEQDSFDVPLQSALIKLAHDLKQRTKTFRHDARQPLSTISLVSSVGKALSSNTEQSQRFEHLQSSQKALSKLIDHFLSSIDTAMMNSINTNNTPFRPVELRSILEPLVEEYRHLANSKGLELRYVDTPLTVYSNAEHLEKIIRNGLDNAIKYTREGGVVVGVRRLKEGGARITVTDTGSGIDNNKVADKDKGWGYGSTIVKELSQKIGVNTRVRNRTGRAKGSEFSIVLQAESLIQPQEAAKTQEKVKSILACSSGALPEAQQLQLGTGISRPVITRLSFHTLMWETMRLGKISSYFFYIQKVLDVEKTMKVITQLESLGTAHCRILLIVSPQCEVLELPARLQGYARLKASPSPQGELIVEGLEELLSILPSTANASIDPNEPLRNPESEKKSELSTA